MESLKLNFRRMRKLIERAQQRQEYLCTLVEKGHMDRVAELGKNGRYFCGLCGRVAAKAENVCDPIERMG
jgi:hypothetical protein